MSQTTSLPAMLIATPPRSPREESVQNGSFCLNDLLARLNQIEQDMTDDTDASTAKQPPAAALIDWGAPREEEAGSSVGPSCGSQSPIRDTPTANDADPEVATADAWWTRGAAPAAPQQPPQRVMMTKPTVAVASSVGSSSATPTASPLSQPTAAPRVHGTPMVTPKAAAGNKGRWGDEVRRSSNTSAPAAAPAVTVTAKATPVPVVPTAAKATTGKPVDGTVIGSVIGSPTNQAAAAAAAMGWGQMASLTGSASVPIGASSLVAPMKKKNSAQGVKPTTPLDADRPKGAPQVDLNKFRTKVCRNWASGLPCQYGDRCAFAHGSENLRTTTEHNPCLEVYGKPTGATSPTNKAAPPTAARRPPTAAWGGVEGTPIATIQQQQTQQVQITQQAQLLQNLPALAALAGLQTLQQQQQLLQAVQQQQAAQQQGFQDPTGCMWFGGQQ